MTSLLLSAQVAENSLHVLSGDELTSLDQDARLDLIAMRLNRALLDDNRVMKYFILLNNCEGSPDIQGKVNSEFEFPKMAAFYKAKADEILSKNISNSVTVNVGPLALGEYDMQKKAFPFIEPTMKTKRPIAASGLNVGHSNISPRCGDQQNRWYGPMHGLWPFHVAFTPIKFDYFPVDETAARDYVASLANKSDHQRYVFLVVDMDILNNPTGDNNNRAAVRGWIRHGCISNRMSANSPVFWRGERQMQAATRYRRSDKNVELTSSCEVCHQPEGNWLPLSSCRLNVQCPGIKAAISAAAA